jgi:hypothetical protein
VFNIPVPFENIILRLLATRNLSIADLDNLLNNKFSSTIEIVTPYLNVSQIIADVSKIELALKNNQEMCYEKLIKPFEYRHLQDAEEDVFYEAEHIPFYTTTKFYFIFLACFILVLSLILVFFHTF